MISAIIPAYNEEDRIEAVIRAVEMFAAASEILVVSDGSTDKTADRARRTSARVIELPVNQGKAHAMDIAMSQASGDLLLFLDADLTGLTAELLQRLAEPVLTGGNDMAIFARDHWLDDVQYCFPAIAIGGERIVRRALWNLVPAQERKGFQIELALNHYARYNGMRYEVVRAPGLRHVEKVFKYGWRVGLPSDLRMNVVCIMAFLRYCMREWREPKTRVSASNTGGFAQLFGEWKKRYNRRKSCIGV